MLYRTTAQPPQSIMVLPLSEHSTKISISHILCLCPSNLISLFLSTCPYHLYLNIIFQFFILYFLSTLSFSGSHHNTTSSFLIPQQTKSLLIKFLSYLSQIFYFHSTASDPISTCIQYHLAPPFSQQTSPTLVNHIIFPLYFPQSYNNLPVFQNSTYHINI